MFSAGPLGQGGGGSSPLVCPFSKVLTPKNPKWGDNNDETVTHVEEQTSGEETVRVTQHWVMCVKPEIILIFVNSRLSRPKDNIGKGIRKTVARPHKLSFFYVHLMLIFLLSLSWFLLEAKLFWTVNIKSLQLQKLHSWPHTHWSKCFTHRI